MINNTARLLNFVASRQEKHRLLCLFFYIPPPMKIRTLIESFAGNIAPGVSIQHFSCVSKFCYFFCGFSSIQPIGSINFDFSAESRSDR